MVHLKKDSEDKSLVRWNKNKKPTQYSGTVVAAGWSTNYCLPVVTC